MVIRREGAKQSGLLAPNEDVTRNSLGTSISDMGMPVQDSDEDNRKRLRTALGFVAVCSFLVLPVAFLAFWLDSPPNPPLFFGFLAVAEFFVFCCLSPISSCTMW